MSEEDKINTALKRDGRATSTVKRLGGTMFIHAVVTHYRLRGYDVTIKGERVIIELS